MALRGLRNMGAGVEAMPLDERARARIQAFVVVRRSLAAAVLATLLALALP